MSTEDQQIKWDNATFKLINPPFDGADFAELLKGGSPLPQGTRDMLAEMLDPASSGYLGLRLKIETAKGVLTMDPDRQIQALEFKIAFDEMKEKGEPEPSKAAAEEVGERHGVSSRTIERRAEEFRLYLAAVAKWIKRRPDS